MSKIKDVIGQLESLENIKRPEGDNEGEDINSEAILSALGNPDREMVLEVSSMIHDAVRKPGEMGDVPDNRFITALNRNGYRTNLNPSQSDPTKLVGSISKNGISIDISDLDPTNHDD